MKKWKIILAVISVMLLAGAGTLYYLLEVKSYETQDATVEEVVAEEYDIALPGEEAASEDPTGEEVDAGEETAAGEKTSAEGATESAVSEGTNESNKQTSGNSNSSTTATRTVSNAAGKSAGSSSDKTVSSTFGKTENKQGSETKAKPTAAQVAAKYEPTFLQLEAQANGKIGALVGHAIGEYVEKKQNGEEVSYFYFYSKYNTAGKILERNTDKAFNYVYNALVKDLKDNGYDSTEAKKYKTAYEAAKKERRSALINKAKSAL